MKKVLSMALVLMMVLTLLAVPTMAADSINITEVNDYGTVVAEVGANTITVVTEPGYYIQSATLNGEAVTFARAQQLYTNSGEYYLPKFEVSNSDTVLAHKEVWEYTLDDSALTADANFVITYAAYTQTRVCVGDAESEGQDFSGSGTTIVTDDKNGGNASYFVASGNFDATPFSWEAGEKYMIKWDAKAKETEVTNMYLYGMGKNSVSTSNKNRVYLHGIVVPTTWKSYTMFITAAADQTNGEVYFKSVTNTYFDNLSIVKLTEASTPAPSSFNVTIAGDAGANVSIAAATSEGEAVDFTVTPKFGYYIASVTVGDADVTAAVDAYKGGTYSTGAIEADTEIVVRTASYAANDKGVSTDVATLPSAFASTASTVTFGKVLDDSATSYGVELTQNGQPVLTYHGGGPLYKANSKNENGQYAVEFVGLDAGEYTVRTYVIVGGTKTFGAPATFVVE